MSKQVDGDPWERQEGESAKAFLAFTEYLLMDAWDRSIPAVARKLGYKSEKTCREWSTKFRWVERVTKYEEDRAARARKRREKEIEKMNARHADAGLSLIGKGLERLVGVKDPSTGQIVGKISLVDISASEVAKLIDVGATLERKARELPDQVVTINGKLETTGSEDRFVDAIARLSKRLREDQASEGDGSNANGAESTQLPMGDVGSPGSTSSEG